MKALLVLINICNPTIHTEVQMPTVDACHYELVRGQRNAQLGKVYTHGYCVNRYPRDSADGPTLHDFNAHNGGTVCP